MRPIIIIMEGKCKIVNPYDGYVVAILKRGDVMGESDFLRLTVSYLHKLNQYRVMISLVI